MSDDNLTKTSGCLTNQSFMCIPNIFNMFSDPLQEYWKRKHITIDDVTLNTDDNYQKYNKQADEWDKKLKEACIEFKKSGSKNQQLKQKAAYFLKMKNHCLSMANKSLQTMSNLQIQSGTHELAKNTLNATIATKKSNYQIKQTLKPMNNLDKIEDIYEESSNLQDQVEDIFEISNNAFKQNGFDIEDELQDYINDINISDNSDIIINNNTNNNLINGDDTIKSELTKPDINLFPNVPDQKIINNSNNMVKNKQYNM